MDQVTVSYQGKQVTASLSEGQTMSGEVLGSDRAPQWYVTIAGTALTRFPATATDTEEQVRERVLRWLGEHPEMLDRDQIVLGGG
ncbi:MAG TPA: hypothetical protein VNO19_14595 [Gemmatimonadales bacterium]|nr:hypothetical protein [Gemmatimonadales bacterium]